MKAIIQNVRITSISSCLPKNVFDLKQLSQEYGHLEVEKIISSTGISKLRLADDSTCASDLCETAAKQLIESNCFNKDEIDGIVFVSQTPDYILPATSLSLQKRLGIGNNCVAFDISYGCSAYIYGLFQGAMLVSSGVCQKVLICAGDKISSYVNQKDRSIKMLFGDAGSATVIEKGEQTIYFDFFSDGNGGDRLIIPAGGSRYPYDDYSGIIKERENGNYRSDNDLFMDGISIMNFALKEVPLSINNVCTTAGWDKSEVGMYGLHQANEFMLKYIAKIMRVPLEKVPITMKETGNTGPASIPLMLTESKDLLKNQNMLGKVILCGFGVGLSLATAALSLEHTTILKTCEYEH